uniref:Transmembrane protein n=1 Tax=Strongyloides venezuelensis TaxID=75913 RepID=A0A0K0G288_STRVS
MKEKTSYIKKVVDEWTSIKGEQDVPVSSTSLISISIYQYIVIIFSIIILVLSYHCILLIKNLITNQLNLKEQSLNESSPGTKVLKLNHQTKKYFSEIMDIYNDILL